MEKTTTGLVEKAVVSRFGGEGGLEARWRGRQVGGAVEKEALWIRPQHVRWRRLRRVALVEKASGRCSGGGCCARRVLFFLQWREGTDRSGYESLVGIAAHKRDVRVDGCPSGTITVFSFHCYLLRTTNGNSVSRSMSVIPLA
jgi:hypothetical protein